MVIFSDIANDSQLKRDSDALTGNENQIIGNETVCDTVTERVEGIGRRTHAGRVIATTIVKDIGIHSIAQQTCNIIHRDVATESSDVTSVVVQSGFTVADDVQKRRRIKYTSIGIELPLGRK